MQTFWGVVVGGFVAAVILSSLYVIWYTRQLRPSRDSTNREYLIGGASVLGAGYVAAKGVQGVRAAYDAARLGLPTVMVVPRVQMPDFINWRW